MQDIPLNGSLAGIFFPRLVARLQAEEFEGTLRVSTGTTLKVIYFKRGEIASAASNAEGDRLPSILIQDGRLTQPQLEMARSRVTPEKSLGKALIEMGFLTPSELLQGARRQVRQILASCFRLRDGTYQIESGPLPPEVTVLGLPTRRLIFDALLEATDRSSTVNEIGSMETVYAPVEDGAGRLASLRLEVALDELARRFDGRATLRELSQGTSLDDFTVGRTALALEILGLLRKVEIEAAPEAEPEPPRLIPIETTDAPPPGEVSPYAGEPAAGDVAVTEAAPAEGSSWSPAWTPSATTTAVEAEPARPTSESAWEEPDVGRESRTEALEEAPSEMPPIPAEDLPAFARSDEEAGVEEESAGWSVDPQTGDRVRLGPVEMTFDGRVGTAPEPGGRLGRLVGYAAVALLAVVSALWFVTRRGAGAGAELPVQAAATGERPAASVPAPEAHAQPHPVPAEEPPAAPAAAAAASPAPGEVSLAPAQEQSPAPSPTGPQAHEESPSSKPEAEIAQKPAPPEQEEPATPSAPSSAEAPKAGAPAEALATAEGPAPAQRPAAEPAQVPAETPAPKEKELPPTVPMAGSVAFSDAAGASRARQSFDADELVEAAARFQDLIAAEPAGRVTLQLMIACEPETLRTARARAGASAPLFVLPVTIKERSCYRACWGVYDSKEAALAAVAGLPPAYTGPGVKPIVVSLARLRPAP